MISSTKGTIERRIDFWQSKAAQYTTMMVYYPPSEIKVNGYGVRYINGLYNFWAWVAPISPYTQYLRRKQDEHYS